VESDKSEDVIRFTMGKGPSGIEREAYYAGWAVVGYWLEHRMTFAEIARIPGKEMPRRVGETIDTLLAAKQLLHRCISSAATLFLASVCLVDARCRETTRLLLRPVWGSSEMSNALTHPVP
jgi:hypothetical protein